MFDRSRRNLAHWFAFSMGSILIAFAGVGYFFTVEENLRLFDEDLFRQSKPFAGKVQYLLYQNKTVLEDEVSLNNRLTYVRWYNTEKQLVQFLGSAGTQQLTAEPGFQTVPQSSGSDIWLRQITIPVLRNKVLVGYLQTAAPLTSLRESLHQARLFLTLGIPVTFSLIGITGWFLGGLAMRPSHQAYEQLQRFTADASHELRAPIATILSNAQVALIPPEELSEQRLRLQNIVETAKSMSILINNLLFLSRHAGSLAATSLQTFDLVKLLYSVTLEYSAYASAQKLTLIQQLPEQPVNIRADPNLLRQAITNLLSNAFKYTPPGGTIWIKLFIQANRAIIQVENNGIGIPSEDLPHIFERFYRVDTVRSRSTGGFGLGLSIAQQIVQAHRGEITANSTISKGSLFQINLPVKR